MAKVPIEGDTANLVGSGELAASDTTTRVSLNSSQFFFASSLASPATALSIDAIDAIDAGSASIPDSFVASWLEQLFQHFGLHELKEISDQKLLSLLSELLSESELATRTGVSALVAHAVATKDSAFLSHIRHRIVRLAGAHLDTTFMAMAPDVIDIEDVELIILTIESRALRGVRCQNQRYRLANEFALCHQLQAFCLARTLEEKNIDYLMTRSTQHFAVWIKMRTLPCHNYPQHLSSVENIDNLAS